MHLKTLSTVFAVGVVLVGTPVPSIPSEATPLSPQSPIDLDVCGAPSLPTAHVKARALVTQIRADLAAVEEEIRHVPFLSAVEAGTVPVEQIAAVAAEEYSIIRSDMQSFASMAQRWDTPTGRHFFGDLAAGEAFALPLLLAFGAHVGLDEQALAAYEPRPKAQTYPSRVAWIAANADRASAAASFLVNFGVFGENMARVRDALIRVYGFAPEDISNSR